MKNTFAPSLSPLIFIAAIGIAQPLLAQNMVNPLTLFAPTQSNPWSGGYGNISSPFGLGALNPTNPLNSINPLSPWNNFGGMSNPALSLGALGALGALAPNLLPSGSPFGNAYPGNAYPGNPFGGNPFAANAPVGNPFGGNPFAANAYPGSPFPGNAFQGNPYARPQAAQPFGMPAFSPSMPSFPNMPFAAQPQQQQQNPMQGGYYPMQQQQKLMLHNHVYIHCEFSNPKKQ